MLTFLRRKKEVSERTTRSIKYLRDIDRYHRMLSDGSLSDTAVGPLHGLERREHGKPSSERGSKVTTPTQFTGMGKKSNSTSQLSATGKLNKFQLLLSTFLSDV